MIKIRKNAISLIITLTILLLVPMDVTSEASEWHSFRKDITGSGYVPKTSNLELTSFKPLWTYQLGGAIRTIPVTADLDGDGNLEVVIASSPGGITALDASGNLLWNFHLSKAIRSTPTVMDINEDLLPEIIFGADDGILRVLNSTGDLIWEFITGGNIRSSPLVVHLDDFPKPEIVFGSMDEKVYCLNSKGVELWSFATGDPVVSMPVVVDLDSDGDYEVVVGSMDNVLHILKSPPSKKWAYLTNEDIIHTTVIDPYDNIYVPSGKKFIKLHYTEYTTSTGVSMSGLSQIWVYNTTYEITTSPSLGYIDDDSEVDLVFGAGKELIALKADGERLFRYSVSKRIRSSPAVADIDGDDIDDIVFGTQDGTLFIINYPGRKKWMYSLDCILDSSPSISDLNGDSSFEVLIGCKNGQLFVFGGLSNLRKAEAIKLYDLSLSMLDIGDIAGAEDYIVEARKEFSEIGETLWVVKCNNLILNINGYEWLSKARMAFDDGDLIGSRNHLNQALHVFILGNDSDGLSKVKDFSNNVDADLYLLESKYLFDERNYKNASAYANAAKMYYELRGDLVGMAEADKMVNASLIAVQAISLFEAGQKAMLDGEYEKSGKLLDEARVLLEVINDTDGLRSLSMLSPSVNAFETYSVALDLFYHGEFERSMKYAEKSVNLFNDLGLVNDSYQSKALISRLVVAIDAERMINNAILMINASEYDAAYEYSKEAYRLFNYSDIPYGKQNALIIMNVSKTRMDQQHSNFFKYLFVNLFPITLLILGVFVLSTIIYRIYDHRIRAVRDEDSPDKDY